MHIVIVFMQKSYIMMAKRRHACYFFSLYFFPGRLNVMLVEREEKRFMLMVRERINWKLDKRNRVESRKGNNSIRVAKKGKDAFHENIKPFLCVESDMYILDMR